MLYKKGDALDVYWMQDTGGLLRCEHAVKGLPLHALCHRFYICQAHRPELEDANGLLGATFHGRPPRRPALWPPLAPPVKGRASLNETMAGACRGEAHAEPTTQSQPRAMSLTSDSAGRDQLGDGPTTMGRPAQWANKRKCEKALARECRAQHLRQTARTNPQELMVRKYGVRRPSAAYTPRQAAQGGLLPA